MVKVWTDGATTRFAVIFDKEDLKETTGNNSLQDTWIIKTKNKVTNNVGEYLAIMFALEKCVEFKLQDVVIISDSQLCICQLKGMYNVNSPTLMKLWQQVKDLEKKIGNMEYRWIAREYNKAGRLLG